MKTFFAKAQNFHREGNFLEAKKYYHLAINENPKNIEALNLLGIINAISKQYNDSLDCFNKAIKINPNFIDGHFNKGNVFKELKQFDYAITAYNKVLELDPVNIKAYCNKGIVLVDVNLLDEAIICFKKAVDINSNFDAAYLNLGNALLKKNKFKEALLNYNTVIKLNSNFAEAYYNSGIAHRNLGNFDAAIFNYKKAINLNPNYSSAYKNLANIFLKLKKIKSYIKNYEKFLMTHPDEEFIFGKYVFAKNLIFEWSSFYEDKKKLENDIIKKKAIISPFESLFLIDSPSLLLDVAKTYSQKMYKFDKFLEPLIQKKSTNKIKLGYFSGDFWEHPVSYLTAELFKLHDRNKFEVIGFSFHKKNESKMRNQLMSVFDRFIDLNEMSDIDIAKLAREMNIDIAIDLSGETENGRSGVFAHRVAPIQINYIGFLGSSGSSYYDYLISDKMITPKELQKFFTEKIIYLPSFQVNQYNNNEVKIGIGRSEYNLPKDKFVYCCFNNNYKILPNVFDNWMKILKLVPDSVLFLYLELDEGLNNLRKEVESRGVDFERIIIAKKVNRENYFSRFLNCDLFLDTLPYNAGATAADALWAGLPLLTQIGNSFSGRVASSLLQAIDLPELITYTPDEYVAKAIELAKYPNKLQEIKMKLSKNKFSSLLFDNVKFTRHLEMAYYKIWDRYNNNLPTEDIEIENID